MSAEHFYPTITERPNWEVFWPSHSIVMSHRDFPDCATFNVVSTGLTLHGDGIIVAKKSLRSQLKWARESAARERELRGLPP